MGLLERERERRNKEKPTRLDASNILKPRSDDFSSSLTRRSLIPFMLHVLIICIYLEELPGARGVITLTLHVHTEQKAPGLTAGRTWKLFDPACKHQPRSPTSRHEHVVLVPSGLDC